LNPTWEKEAAYSYYAHGPLARTVIGEQEVQGLDYVYTLQGWIKGVNSNNLDANNDPGKDGLGLSANHRVAQDVMGYSLHYFNNDYLPIVNGNTTFIAAQSNSDMLQNSSDLYNGNIARMVTTITDPDSRAVLPLGNAYRYDQLNRLKHAVSFDLLNGNAWAGGATAKYQNSFTYDANGNILTQTRKDDNNQVIDELAYFYPQNAANKTVRNRLLYVSDNVDYDASDIDPGMAINNYSYDAEGRLIQDLQEGIDEIKWRVDGKVKSIKQSDNKPGEYSLSFDYDAMGHRIAKHSYDKNQAYNNGLGQLVKSTYYVLDAQGNTIATYERAVDENTLQISYAQTEKFIYGSSRLGVQNCNIALLGSQNNTYTQTTVAHRIGKKGYELSNHLGNVLSVISDKAIPHNNGGGVVDYFLADIRQAQDYSPFGVLLQNRNLSLSGANPFRFGFGGHEKDDEVKGSSNHLSFGDMVYDPKIVRRWRTDPFQKLYAPISPYAYALNSPIMFTDSDGNVVIGSDGKPVTYERGEDGVVKWSENATTDVIEVGNAMLSTEFGEKAFNKWQNADTKITITIDREIAPEDGNYAETKPTLADDGYGKVNKDGQYEEAEIIFYEKNIEKNREEGSGERFEGASREETLGAVGTHEVYHNEKKQINLDIRQPIELEQNPKKNLPINSEMNFRKEYHEKKPGQKNSGTWEQNYKQSGYEGVDEQI
jgi:RHS repeat-associated protein